MLDRPIFFRFLFVGLENVCTFVLEICWIQAPSDVRTSVNSVGFFFCMNLRSSTNYSA